MPGVLEELRTRRDTMYSELETLSKVEKPSDEQRARFKTLDTEYTALDEDITVHEHQAEREQRAAASRAAASGGTGTDHTAANTGTGWSVESEPMTYGRGSGHSYFLDMARDSLKRGDGDGGVQASRDRLNRHAAELRVEMPKRREARDRRAREELNRVLLTGNRHERRAAERAMTRMDRAGVTPFESRAMNRVDGSGGYLIPPLWMVDELVPYLRADRTFADQWRGMELPAGTDNINIPRLKRGSATGPQAADGAPVNGQDPQDDFVTGKVQTISGQVDVALQLIEQTPLANFDEILMEDLSSDMNLQLSGQCYVGTGSGGQIKGVWPAGSIGTTHGIVIANTTNVAQQTWVNGGGGTFSVNGSVYQSGGQMLSVIARTRMRPATGHVWHPWVWYYLMTQVDQQGRPLVVPGTPNNIGFNQVGIDDDGPVTEGPAGFYQGLRVVLDPNMPVTFPASGGTNPQITTLSAGQVAPTPGSGLFTPLLAGAWNDLLLFEGELRTRALDQVLSGNLQMRFQMYKYCASIPDRFQAYNDVSTGGSVVVNANSSVSYATLTQFSATPANSVLNMTQQGF